MEAIIMDKLFNATKIIDVFISFIWDEPYIGYGTFELEFPMNPFIMAGVEEGYYVAITQSKRYMVIDKIDIKNDVEEGDTVVISGRSLESLLTRRIIRYDIASDGSVQTFCQRAFNANSFAPQEEHREIPQIVFKASEDVNVTSENISISVKAGEYLYDALCKACEYCHLGFRVIPYKDGGMCMELYAGADRSYAQNINPWVVFSPKYENLNNSEMIIDYTNYKNVIIVEYTYTEKVFSGWATDDDGKLETDSDGNLIAEYEEREITETIELGNTSARGLDRREMFIHIDANIDFVDRSVYGVPGDRVNEMEYKEWGITSFNEYEYNQALNKWMNDLSSRAPRRDFGNDKKYEWVMTDYYAKNPQLYEQIKGTSAEHLAWTRKALPETDAEFEKRSSRFWALAEGSKPKMSDYYSYGWKWKPGGLVAYNEAIQEALAEINAEYQAALDNARNKMLDTVKEEGMATLAPYLIVTNFNGEVDFGVNYQYNTDYFLGDIVQIVDKHGYQATTRMVSILLSQNSSDGKTTIPTFESDDEAEVTL